MIEASITKQGSFFKLKVTNSPYQREIPEKRGKIKGFSPRARKRMFELFNRMHVKHFVFITMTYGQNFPQGDRAKRDLKVFIQRLKRFYPQVAGVWRIEFQKRGAPHFHLLLTNLPFLPKEKLLAMWEAVISPQHRNQTGDTFTRVELVKSKKKAMSYVSKYVGKRSQPQRSVGSGFNSVPYQTALGKHWGIIGREYLPFAKETNVFIEVDKAVYKRFKRVFRWSTKIDKLDNFWVGMTIFSDRADVWLELLLMYAYEEN